MSAGQPAKSSKEKPPTVETTQENIELILESPTWKEKGKEPVPISSMDVDTLLECLETVRTKTDKRRNLVVINQRAILRLLELEGAIGNQLKELGYNLVIPDIEF